MIKGSFKRNESGHIVSFEVTGHAEAGPYGSDIVCAAVSALTFNTVNGIESLAGFQPLVDMNDEDGGYLYVETIKNVTGEQVNISQILLENLLLGLQAVEAEEPEFIQIATVQTK